MHKLPPAHYRATIKLDSRYDTFLEIALASCSFYKHSAMRPEKFNFYFVSELKHSPLFVVQFTCSLTNFNRFDTFAFSRKGILVAIHPFEPKPLRHLRTIDNEAGQFRVLFSSSVSNGKFFRRSLLERIFNY